jgi:SCY1-like protein 1
VLRLVRDQAFKTLELFINKLQTHAATMVSIAVGEEALAKGLSQPETALLEDGAPAPLPFGLPLPQGSQSAAIASSAAGAAGALAGWAISSLGKTVRVCPAYATVC